MYRSTGSLIQLKYQIKQKQGSLCPVCGRVGWQNRWCRDDKLRPARGAAFDVIVGDGTTSL